MLQIFRTNLSKHYASITMYVCIGMNQLTIQRLEYQIQILAHYKAKSKPYVNVANPHKLSVNNRFMTLATQQKRPYSRSKHESKINN